MKHFSHPEGRDAEGFLFLPQPNVWNSWITKLPRIRCLIVTGWHFLWIYSHQITRKQTHQCAS